MRIDAVLRFEIISTCCAALGGGFLAAVISWFSPWSAWTAEVAFVGFILCGSVVLVVHLLLREMEKVEIERQNKHKADEKKN